MVGIEEIDRASATMTVQAGTPLETVQKAADDSRLVLPARSGIARLLRDRRQPFHQCRRQSRHPLRHDARTGARPRSGAAGRHHRHQPQQAAEEQRRLRSEAAVHRLGRHARHHHARRIAAVSETALHHVGALRAGGLPRGACAARRGAQRARSAAVGVRSDVAGLLGGDYGARRRALAGRHRPWPLCAGGSAGHRREHRCAAVRSLARRPDGARTAADAAVAQSVAQTKCVLGGARHLFGIRPGARPARLLRYRACGGADG